MELSKEVRQLIPQHSIETSKLMSFRSYHVWYDPKDTNIVIYEKDDGTLLRVSEVSSTIIPGRQYQGRYVGLFQCKFLHNFIVYT